MCLFSSPKYLFIRKLMDSNQALDSHFVIECILVIPVRVSRENIHINSARIYEKVCQTFQILENRDQSESIFSLVIVRVQTFLYHSFGILPSPQSSLLISGLLLRLGYINQLQLSPSLSLSLCLSPSLSLSLSLCLSVSVSQSQCLSVSVSGSQCLSVSVSQCLSVSVSQSQCLPPGNTRCCRPFALLSPVECSEQSQGPGQSVFTV